MKFTQIPSDTFQKLVLNAGILVDAFNPATGVIGNLLGATTGGIQFSTNPEFTDFGEDIDNCPNNTMELKKLDSFDPQMSGTFLTVTPAVAKQLVGAADVDSDDSTHVVPRADLLTTDFDDLWWIGDYSDVNTGDNAGFLAIHLMNALNTGGIQIQSEKNNKGQLAFEFHGHYSIEDTSEVPFEIYIKSGTDTTLPSVVLNKHAFSMKVGDSAVQLTATTTPAGKTVTWTSSATGKAQVSNGSVSAVDEGSAIITAKITVDGVDYTDTCTVIVEAAAQS